LVLTILILAGAAVILKGRLKLWAGDRITGVVHVDDLVAAMILAAEKGKPGEHYIISAT